MRRPRPRRRSALALLAAALAVGLTACGDAPESTAAVATTQITVRDSEFAPAHAEVPSGTEVTWQWTGRQPHDVVGPGFESEVQRAGSFTHTFTEPGVYSFACTIHRGMTGAVTVVD